MGSGNSNDVFGWYAELLAIPGGEDAVISPLPGQNAAILKYFSGGSLLIIAAGSALGSTYAIENEYLVGTSELVSMDLRGPITLGATGSTCLAYLLRTRSAGF